jgi:cell division septation protein DedD
MKNNDSGEFELVLGNRQLLSGFFVVALLFGVFFAMGYIVGRNSAPSPKLQAEAASGTTAVGDVRPAPAAPAEPVKAPEEPAAGPPASDAPVQPTTQPAREGPSAAPPEPASTAAAVAEPSPGNYWQVIATQQAQAEIVAKALKDKGFPTSLGPGPNNLVRVLVGPYQDAQTLGHAKSELENAGFRPILKK